MAIHTETNCVGSKPGATDEGLAPAILDALSCGVLLVDSRGRILYRNDRAAMWTDDVDNLDSVFGEARFPAPLDGWRDLLKRVTETGENLAVACFLDRSKPDKASLLTLHCHPLSGTSGNPPTGVAITIQQREQARAIVDERAEIAQRLVSLGKLAARVAHELNNPLDGILRYVNLALRVAEEVPKPRLKSYLKESRTGLLRMVRIIGDLLEYSRTSNGEFDAMSINEVVEQAIRNVSAAARSAKILVAADFQENNMPIVGGSRLYQICCNLMKNALDAMPDGGRLTITTGLIDGDVIIRFTDTGEGLPDDVDGLFRPFFTTKEPGKGTGLGLAICREFAEAMRGTITAAPSPTGGAVFTVCIPVSGCRRPARLADRTAVREAGSGTTGHVVHRS